MERAPDCPAHDSRCTVEQCILDPAHPDHVVSAKERRLMASFDHHAPSEDQVRRILINRAAFKCCAAAVLSTCSDSADRTAALRQLHESMMTANKAIACEND